MLERIKTGRDEASGEDLGRSARGESLAALLKLLPEAVGLQTWQNHEPWRAQVEWDRVPTIDIICAGFPCQDISFSGKGSGIEKGEKSGIWKNIFEGIRVLRPKIIVVENVAAIRSRGLNRVLGDLAQLGYDAIWTSVRASDVGAPHKRERVFILGYRPEATGLLLAAHARSQRRGRWAASGQTQSWRTPGGPLRLGALALSAWGYDQAEHAQASRVGDIAWGRYEAAIRRWESVTGRSAPYPVETGTRGQPRLAPAFSEWLMGLPKGFVTDLGLPYGAQHRAIGNGVVPQQAIAALRQLVGNQSGPLLICGVSVLASGL